MLKKTLRPQLRHRWSGTLAVRLDSDLPACASEAMPRPSPQDSGRLCLLCGGEAPFSFPFPQSRATHSKGFAEFIGCEESHWNWLVVHGDSLRH